MNQKKNLLTAALAVLTAILNYSDCQGRFFFRSLQEV